MRRALTDSLLTRPSRRSSRLGSSERGRHVRGRGRRSRSRRRCCCRRRLEYRFLAIINDEPVQDGLDSAIPTQPRDLGSRLRRQRAQDVSRVRERLGVRVHVRHGVGFRRGRGRSFPEDVWSWSWIRCQLLGRER